MTITSHIARLGATGLDAEIPEEVFLIARPGAAYPVCHRRPVGVCAPRA
jgi:hypothetical protein